MKFDMHIHTDLSPDSPETLENMISAAKSAGLDGMAVTNHDIFSGLSEAGDFLIIPAAEYTTDGGHMLTYFIKSSLTDGLSKDSHGRYSWREIVSRAHDMGGLVFLAHPYAPEIKRDEELFSLIDGIEGYNGRVEHSIKKNANRLARTKAAELGLPVSAGSDGHYMKEVGTAYFECEITAADYDERLLQLYSALKNGNGRIYGGRASAVWKVKSGWHKTVRLKQWGRIPKLIPRTIRGLFCSALPKKPPIYIDTSKRRK